MSPSALITPPAPLAGRRSRVSIATSPATNRPLTHDSPIPACNSRTTPAMPKPRTTQVKPKRSGPLVLAADCRTRQCNDLQSTQSCLLPRVAPVELDARAVQQIDAATLQLLAAFVRERQSKGHSIVWRGT